MGRGAGEEDGGRVSAKAVTWALKQPVPQSSAKFVLVVLAECVNGESFVAWPSIAHVIEATGQDRKTVQANIRRLQEWGWIEDTGEREGTTKQVVVYRLKEPENGPIKEAQKRNSTENGTVPFFPGKTPEIPTEEAQISLETGPKTGHGTVKEPEGNRKEPEQSASRSRKSRLPADFGISDRVRRWAAEKGHVRLDDHLEYFVGWAKSKGATYVDWDEAFMTAIRGNWAKVPNETSRAPPRQTHADRRAEYMRNLFSSTPNEIDMGVVDATGHQN